MDFYAPLFAKVVDSSLWDEPDYVIKIFLTMLAKKDRDQVVRASAYNIASWSKKTEAEVLNALKILESPDTKRLEPQPHEGRRLERVDGGWLVLNGLYYQNLMGIVNRRAKKAEYEKNRRLRLKASGGPAGPQLRETLSAQEHGNGNTETAERLAEPVTAPQNPSEWK